MGFGMHEKLDAVIRDALSQGMAADEICDMVNLIASEKETEESFDPEVYAAHQYDDIDLSDKED